LFGNYLFLDELNKENGKIVQKSIGFSYKNDQNYIFLKTNNT